MARVRSPWHALRPVFLAGAATFAWLTFSSSPASADLLPEPAPAGHEVLVDAPAPDLLAPVVAAVPGTAATDPVAPITAGVDDAVEAVHQVAEPPVSDFIQPVIQPVLEPVTPVLEQVEPVLEPVLAPVVEPVTELVPALEPVLELAPPAPVQAIVGLLSSPAVETAAAAPAVSAGTGVDDSAPAQQALASSAPRVLAAAVPADSGAPTPAAATLLAGPAAAESTDTAPVPPSSPPAPVPAAPGPGGAASGGPSPGSAAWLSPAPFLFPYLGASSAPEFLLHAPEPVSFDPGSSPD